MGSPLAPRRETIREAAMTAPPAPDLVFIGNLIVDDVVHADGRTRMGEAGGAVFYAALGAGLWGVRSGVVSVAGRDYPAESLAALQSRDVDLTGIRRLEGAGLRTWLLYESAGRRIIHQLGRPSHADVSPGPRDIRAAFESARIFHLSPMPFEIQRALVGHLGKRPGIFVSVDPHEPVREENLAMWREVLEGVDAFFPSEDELLLEGVKRDPRPVLRRLGTGRLELVAYKRGAHGGILYQRGTDRFTEWPAIEGPTVD